RWIDENVPFGGIRIQELVGEFRRVSVAVLVSTLATAGVQALAATIGFLIARVPNPVFFTVLTFVLGLVPAVGAASVVLAVTGLLLLLDHTGPAIFLGLWGVIVVGLVDNLLKPLFIRGGLELHGAVIFFSLIGGLAIFGALGLIAGPLIVAFFL